VTERAAGLYRVQMVTSSGGVTHLASYDEEGAARTHAVRAARNTDCTDVWHRVVGPDGREALNVRRGCGA